VLHRRAPRVTVAQYKVSTAAGKGRTSQPDIPPRAAEEIYDPLSATSATRSEGEEAPGQLRRLGPGPPKPACDARAALQLPTEAN
jgi:hypothetical protein